MTGAPTANGPKPRNLRANRALEQFPDEGITRLKVTEPRPELRDDGTTITIGGRQLWRLGEWNYVDWSRVEQWKGLVVAAAKAARVRMDQSHAHLWEVSDLVSLGLLYLVESGDEVRPSTEAVTYGILDATGARYRGKPAPVHTALDGDVYETASGIHAVQDSTWLDGDAPRVGGGRRAPAYSDDPMVRRAAARDRLVRLWRAADLSQREGDWLWWECVEGYQQNEIASAEGVDPSTVSYAVTRALVKLRQAAQG